jgi:ubiquinone/menaquinone biosynthesis C-methylase UbiE
MDLNVQSQKDAFYRLLKEWGELGHRLPNSGIGLHHRVLTTLLIFLNFEEAAFFSHKDKEPYTFMVPLLKNQIETLKNVLFLVEEKDLFSGNDTDIYIYHMESRHQDLFQNLFNQYSEEGYEWLIQSMTKRFEYNQLSDKVVGKKCLEVGCGGGRQCVSLSRLGAASVSGVDFGEDSIQFAEKMKKKLGITNIEYKVANAYDLPFGDSQFDILVSNGVFHILESMDKALEEAFRVLKPGGWMWLYVNGAGGMFNDIMDTIKIIIEGTDRDSVFRLLRALGLNEHKAIHLMDGYYATYIYSRWDDLVTLLGKIGFKDIKRMGGTSPTDFNLNKIQSDPYGVEKFGEGEIRLIAFK